MLGNTSSYEGYLRNNEQDTYKRSCTYCNSHKAAVYRYHQFIKLVILNRQENIEMNKMPFVTVIACLLSISIVMQEAYAQDCATPKISTCTTTHSGAVAGVGGDKNIICSAANTYLDCLNKVFTDCKLNSSSSFISQTIAVAKQALSQYGCGSGNGTGSLVFNLVTMMSGLTMSGLVFYKLF